MRYLACSNQHLSLNHQKFEWCSYNAEERQSPELYASNVRKVMGQALGAELSTHGIPQQQALKHNGIYVDWTGR